MTISEQGRSIETIAVLKWPETMWPFTPTYLSWLPNELIPDLRDLEQLRYPWELLNLLQETAKTRITETRISPLATIDETARIQGPVWIDAGASILDTTHIDGPTYIGKGATIGTFCIVRACIVGAQSTIGAKSDMTRSVIGPSSSLHNAYVGDSIVGTRVTFGGASGTSNQKVDKTAIPSIIDGKRIHTKLDKLGAMIGDATTIAGGVNIMPGVKIGHDAQILPGVVLGQDVPDHTTVFLRQNQGRLTIKPKD